MLYQLLVIINHHMKTINLSFAQMAMLTVSCLVLGMIIVGYVAAQTAALAAPHPALTAAGPQA